MVTITLYVDDVPLVGRHVQVLERTKEKLISRFSIMGMGDVSLVLGMASPGTARPRSVWLTHARTDGAVSVETI